MFYNKDEPKNNFVLAGSQMAHLMRKAWLRDCFLNYAKDTDGYESPSGRFGQLIQNSRDGWLFTDGTHTIMLNASRINRKVSPGCFVQFNKWKFHYENSLVYITIDDPKILSDDGCQPLGAGKRLEHDADVSAALLKLTKSNANTLNDLLSLATDSQEDCPLRIEECVIPEEQIIQLSDDAFWSPSKTYALESVRNLSTPIRIASKKRSPPKSTPSHIPQSQPNIYDAQPDPIMMEIETDNEETQFSSEVSPKDSSSPKYPPQTMRELAVSQIESQEMDSFPLTQLESQPRENLSSSPEVLLNLSSSEDDDDDPMAESESVPLSQFETVECEGRTERVIHSQASSTETPTQYSSQVVPNYKAWVNALLSVRE